MWTTSPRACSTSPEPSVGSRSVAATNAAGHEKSARETGRLAADVVAAADRDGLRVVGVNLAVPGLVTDRGVVRLAPNLGWREVDVAGALRAADIGVALTGASLTVDNEANLGALAELDAVLSHDRIRVHLGRDRRRRGRRARRPLVARLARVRRRARPPDDPP